MNGRQKKRHMHRQIQRHYDLLKLQWQLYSYTLVVWDIENFRSLVFVAHSVPRLLESYHCVCFFPQMLKAKLYLDKNGSLNSVISTVT